MYNENNPPFKVGDIVQVIDGVNRASGLSLNSIHTVMSMSYEMNDWWVGVKCKYKECDKVSSGKDTNWRHTVFKLHSKTEGLAKEIYDIQTMGYKG